ncbi:MAG: glycosyltransferase family 4 protein [Bacteroidetes bacterium]|nr:glycosyltransferase family 4 protein [Bacteroidota bacterium]
MASPTNIAALAPYRFSPPRSGGEKAIACFYTYLGKHLPVTVLSVKENQWSENPGYEFIPVFSSNKLRYINPLLFFRIRKILRKRNCTHLIIEHPYFGWLGLMLKWFAGIKLIVKSHNIEGIRFKSTGKWWWKILLQYEQFIHRNANVNLFITNEDRDFAVNKFKINPASCFIITYGSETSKPPSAESIQLARKTVRNIHHLDPNRRIFFFNGVLDYKPNMDAVHAIIHYINPGLQKQSNLEYSIIICGKNLPENLRRQIEKPGSNMIYAGFVDDIAVYFKGADVFLNPVTGGGGIKTKLVEALGYNLSCVSTTSGAQGIPLHITGEKLLVTPDNDWDQFTNAISSLKKQATIPQSFFDYFYWDNIAGNAASIIENQLND